MINLSININKIATLRNSRGGNNPDLIKTALDIERFGGQGITVHPRPDERHIRYRDVYGLKKVIATELNIEGNCTEEKFVALVLASQPAQVTLVPDVSGQITSNQGWNTVEHKDFLIRMISLFKSANIRTSIFVDPVIEMVAGAAATGADRIELYTEAYAKEYTTSNKEAAIKPYIAAAEKANQCGLGINAGHDLDQANLGALLDATPDIGEVSIGHALIDEALYAGLSTTVAAYLRIIAAAHR